LKEKIGKVSLLGCPPGYSWSIKPNSWRLDTRGWNELTPATGHGSKLGFSGIMHITWVRVKIRAIFSNGAVRRSKAMIFYDFNFFFSIWKWCINMDLFKWRSKILFFFRWKTPVIVKKFSFRYEFLYSKQKTGTKRKSGKKHFRFKTLPPLKPTNKTKMTGMHKKWKRRKTKRNHFRFAGTRNKKKSSSLC